MTRFRVDNIFNGRYQLLEKVGIGGFAEVWRAADTLTDTIVALKILSPENELPKVVRQSYVTELRNTLGLSNAHLLCPLHYDEYEGYTYIVMPFCDGGALEDIIKRQQKFSERELAKLMLHTATALDYIHKKNVLHNDIKPGNILVKDGDYLLSDFGISTSMRQTVIKNSIGRNFSGQEAPTSTNYALSIPYAAPELFGQQPYNSQETDVFSLGVTLFECATGALPWLGQGGKLLLHSRESVPHLPPETYTRRFNEVLRACLDPIPQNRPTAKELRELAAHYLENGYWPVERLPEEEPAPGPTRVQKPNGFPAKKAGLIAGGALAVLVAAFLVFRFALPGAAGAGTEVMKDPPGEEKVAPLHPSGSAENLAAVIQLDEKGLSSSIVDIQNKEERLFSLKEEHQVRIGDTSLQEGVKMLVADAFDYNKDIEIHFVINSNLANLPEGKAYSEAVGALPKRKSGVSHEVKSISAPDRKKYIAMAAIPREMEGSAFVADVGPEAVTLSWLEGGAVESVAADYGVNFHRRRISTEEAGKAFRDLARQVPRSRQKNCILVGRPLARLANLDNDNSDEAMPSFSSGAIRRFASTAGQKDQGLSVVLESLAGGSGAGQFFYRKGNSYSLGYLLDGQ